MIICIIYVIFSLPGCIVDQVLHTMYQNYQKYKLEDPKGMAEAQEEAINSLDGRVCTFDCNESNKTCINSAIESENAEKGNQLCKEEQNICIERCEDKFD